MADFIEQSIHTFSGLSSETKPTTAGSNNVPNGSRWREIDTGKTWFYNIENDTWYDSDSPDLSVRYEYSGDDLIYRGTHKTFKVATSATGWQVWKYTWNAGDLVYAQGPLPGTWDGRAGLSW